MNHKYRKKPVVVEAFQMTEEASLNDSLWPVWLMNAVKDNFITIPNAYSEDRIIRIYQGNVIHGDWGDYIVIDNHGNLSLCVSDLFEATYDTVAESEEMPIDLIHDC